MKKIKRNLIQIARPVFKIYWFIVRPDTEGVKCVITYKDEVLLIQMSYGHGLWTFPGGGVGKYQTPEAAAKREVAEEVGIEDYINFNAIGQYQTMKEFKNDTVFCFKAEVPARQFNIDEIEVVNAEWFAKNNLPTNRAKQVDKIIAMYGQ